MAVKKTQMYRRNLDGTETNLNPLTESQYVLMENGQTVQEVLSDRDSDKYTPVITNSSSTFKVGQGDSVDLSSSMKEGAYDSCVLKGKTMVNCIQEPSSKDVVLPYEFADGQYVTINDTKESGALGVELKGQTLVNVLNYSDRNDFTTYGGVVDEEKYITFRANNSWNSSVIFKKETAHLKPNTRYTIMLDIKENTITQTGNESIEFGSANSVNPNGYFTNALRPNLVGVKGLWKGLLTTKSSFDNIENSAILLRCYAHVSGVLKVRVSIIEGDYTNVDIPYFTGMASCKMPILSTVGKNLFDYTYWYPLILHNFDYTITGNKINTIIPSGKWFLETTRTNFDKLKEDTIYTVSATSVNSQITILFWKPDGTLIFERGVRNTPITFTTPNEPFVVSVRFCRRLDSDNTVDVQASCENIQIEEGTVATVYEPYKTSILQLPEEVVLRSLPNGVCDTFNTRTGVYTQRIWSATFNGTESYSGWVSSAVAEGMTGIYTRTKVNDKIVTPENQDGQILCDTLPTIHRNQLASCQYDSVIKGINYIGFTMKGKTSDEIKQWLSENPTTVYCELKTPIVTKINLPSTLKSWNTTTHIYSEIPENTLYPTLTHSNPTYPVILKPSTKYSIVANSYSNSHTNSPINFNLGGATASTTVGNRVTTITTPSTLSNELLTMSGRGNKLNNVMVIEGDVVGDEPYFEGMCDCKSPILSNVGKNLFDINNHTENQWSFSSGYPYEQNTSYGDRLKILGDEIHFSTDGGTVNKGVGYYIPLCKNKDYTFRINKKNGNGNYCVKLFLIHSSEYPLKQAIQQHSKFGINNEAITSSLEANFNSANYDMCAIYIGGGWESGTQTTRSYVFNNISLTESNQQVEPYKSNTTTFEQKDDKTIVLRSLPSGVCDTLNVETGEYVQRIGEVILDGSSDEDWSVLPYTPYENGTHYQFKYYLGNPIGGDLWQNAQAITSDTLPSQNYKLHWNGTGEYGIGGDVNYFMITWKKQSSPFTDVTTLRTWLSQNPTTIQYELETPIVSTIDMQGFPYAYTIGHVQLSSGSIEQSLTPKVEYSLSANKTGQINSNTKRVSAHQKQLDDFEAMMLTSMVQSAYDKAILQFDYEMQMMSLGGE